MNPSHVGALGAQQPPEHRPAAGNRERARHDQRQPEQGQRRRRLAQPDDRHERGQHRPDAACHRIDHRQIADPIAMLQGEEIRNVQHSARQHRPPHGSPQAAQCITVHQQCGRRIRQRTDRCGPPGQAGGIGLRALEPQVPGGVQHRGNEHECQGGEGHGEVCLAWTVGGVEPKEEHRGVPRRATRRPVFPVRPSHAQRVLHRRKPRASTGRSAHSITRHFVGGIYGTAHDGTAEIQS